MQSLDDSWSDRAVLVTGCAGFLGCWLSRALCERGARVVGLVRRPPQDSSLFQLFGLNGRVSLVYGQVEDYRTLEAILSDHPVHTVFHVAARSLTSSARRLPRETFETNIRGTWNLLEAVRLAGRPATVIIASSEAVYGASDSLPFTEVSPLGGRSPYAISKISAELLGFSYYQSYGVPVCAGRFTNLYGGGDLNFSRIVPGTIQAVLEGEAPLIRSNGRLVRDYLYVEDAVVAYLTLADAIAQPGVAGEPFNFCSEEPASVLELVDSILRMTNRIDLTPQVLGEPSEEAPVAHSSAAKARTRLGWSAQVSREKGLKQTIEWYRNYWHGHRPTRQGITDETLR
jgi:CDP-glucose 4,6-dehydratase